MPASAFVERLNEQIGHEFAASQQYLAIAVYYDDDTLPRLAAFFYAQALEERNHALMMVQYLLDAGVEAPIPGVAGAAATTSTTSSRRSRSRSSRSGASRDQINALAAIAREEGDYTSEQFMQWFIKEQVEEVATMNDLLKVVERSQDNPLLAEEYIAREHAGDARRGPDRAAPGRRRVAVASRPTLRERRRSGRGRRRTPHPFVRGIGDGTLPGSASASTSARTTCT